MRKNERPPQVDSEVSEGDYLKEKKKRDGKGGRERFRGL
jgi:hypothetical protein